MAILLAALGIAGIAAWISQFSRLQPAIPPAAPAASIPNRAADETAVRPVEPPAGINRAPTNDVVQAKAEHGELVEKRAAELNQLAMETNSEAHQIIVSEMKNPDPAIRQAALEALKQANDRSVVPQMQQIADQTDDAAEKLAILDAIEFINLPALTEYLNQPQKNPKPGPGN